MNTSKSPTGCHYRLRRKEVIDLRTYQDLQAVGQDEKARIAFIEDVIREQKSSFGYTFAVKAKKYYDGVNPTINEYEKLIYDMQGKAHKDMWTANHKIASRFFGFNVDQAVSYLLGNGISFSKKNTLDKLGPDFYEKAWDALKAAQIGGVSFGFWDNGQMFVFRRTEFAPLYDEENGALSAGVRFWQLDDDKPLRCTLYEPDGYTEYIKRKGKAMEVKQKKRKYIIRTTSNKIQGDVIQEGKNYDGFPIVPLKNNEDSTSELYGRQNTIDALDLCTSGMVNNVDEGNIIYWALQNCGGMGEDDAARFLERIKTTHVAFMDTAPDGATAEPHSIEAPYVGTQTAIDTLTKRLYEDFQAFDASAVTAGNQTATAIKASYVPLDLKTDRLERQLTGFINGIFKLAGIDDKPTYTRNQIVNRQEEMQTLLMAAPYADDEYVTTKALTILGDADMVDDVLKRRAADDLGRFDGNNPQGGGDETEEGEENEDGNA